MLNIVDYRLTPQAAVAAPRVHHQFQPDTLYYERGGLSAETLSALGRNGSPAA